MLMMIEQEQKWLLKVSDMRRTVCFSLFLLGLSTGFLYYSMSTLLFVYLQREWEDGHKKIKKRRIRGIENKGNGGNGYPFGTCAGPSLLSWSDPSCFTSFMVFSS
jgi:hypothetical protein